MGCISYPNSTFVHSVRKQLVWNHFPVGSMNSWLQHQRLWLNPWWGWRNKKHIHACILRDPQNWVQMSLAASMAVGFDCLIINFSNSFPPYFMQFSFPLSSKSIFPTYYIPTFMAAYDAGLALLFSHAGIQEL